MVKHQAEAQYPEWISNITVIKKRYGNGEYGGTTGILV